jgi:hypothetical protein
MLVRRAERLWLANIRFFVESPNGMSLLGDECAALFLGEICINMIIKH